MPSEAQICSNALRLLGAKPIVSLSDDSVEGRLCNALYPDSRDEIINSTTHWNFAKARVALGKLATAPAFEYSAQYELPVDFGRVIRVHPSNTIYKIEGRRLLTNQGAINLIYERKDVSDSSLFPPYFVSALQYLLASKLAYPLTKTLRVAEYMDGKYKERLMLAMAANDQEDTQDQISTNDLVDVRTE